MGTALAVAAVILGVLGIVGSIVPALPGPPLSWLGMLMMFLRHQVYGAGEPVNVSVLLVWLGVTVLVTILDYLVPGWMTKMTDGSKYAGWGATIGLLVGMLVPPVGIVLGALAGAFLAELAFAGSDLWTSAKSAAGAFIGFLLGAGLKLMASGIMLWKIVAWI